MCKETICWYSLDVCSRQNT